MRRVLSSCALGLALAALLAGCGWQPPWLRPTATPVPQPTASPTRAPDIPVRLQYVPGTDATGVTGVLAPGGGSQAYLLSAYGGTSVWALLESSPPGRMEMEVRDQAGRSLVPTMDGAYMRYFVPETSDLLITLRSAPGSPAVSYSLWLGARAPSQATPTPAPTATPPSQAPLRIDFAPGSDSATVQGTLQAGGDRRSYVLRATADQTMQIEAYRSPDGTLDLEVQGYDGRLLSGVDTGSGRSYRLPSTQDYLVTISTPSWSSAAGYTMRITIYAPEGPAAERITFAPGQTSAVVEGALSYGGDADAWVLGALQGQTLYIGTTRSPDGPRLEVEVRGRNGVALAGVPQGSDLRYALPTTQDYVITVRAPAGSPSLRYAMRSTVLGQPTDPEVPRISFPSDGAPLSLYGLIRGGERLRWVFNGAAGQTLSVSISRTPPGNTYVDVRDMSGRRLPGTVGIQNRRFVLPESGDFYLDLTSPGWAPESTYSLQGVLR